MGYRIFATSTCYPNDQEVKPYTIFLMEQDDMPLGEDWDMPWVLETAFSLAKVETHSSFAGGLTIKLLTQHARAELGRLLNMALQILCIDGSGKVTLDLTTKNILMPDDRAARTFPFTGDNPRAEFSAFLNFLVKNEFNQMGPLLQMLRAFVKYDQKSDPGEFWITVSMTK